MRVSGIGFLVPETRQHLWHCVFYSPFYYTQHVFTVHVTPWHKDVWFDGLIKAKQRADV